MDRDDSCFFFQAEDGIRDVAVTGVQTCALPICFGTLEEDRRVKIVALAGGVGAGKFLRGLVRAVPPEDVTAIVNTRSEEHTSELQSRLHLVCRLLLEKKKTNRHTSYRC